MQVRQIDPRDQTSEIDDPRYRVYFWETLADPLAWSSDEWEISEADVPEVLAWVDANAGGRLASIWVALRIGPGVQLIRLAGVDPTAPDETWPTWAKPFSAG